MHWWTPTWTDSFGLFIGFSCRMRHIQIQNSRLFSQYKLLNQFGPPKQPNTAMDVNAMDVADQHISFTLPIPHDALSLALVITLTVSLHNVLAGNPRLRSTMQLSRLLDQLSQLVLFSQFRPLKQPNIVMNTEDQSISSARPPQLSVMVNTKDWPISSTWPRQPNITMDTIDQRISSGQPPQSNATMDAIDQCISLQLTLRLSHSTPSLAPA